MSTPAYRVERLTGANEIVAKVAAHEAQAATAFQTSRWLAAQYAELAPAHDARAAGTGGA